MNLNMVALEGNLTKDPELKQFGETTVCKMRLAVNERVKENDEWVNKPGYFDVDVFGRTGENCAQYLAKGSHITVGGRLKWREWTTDEGGKRQAVSIVANTVGFPSKKESEAAGGYDEQVRSGQERAGGYTPPQQDFREQARADTDATFHGDDDIPF